MVNNFALHECFPMADWRLTGTFSLDNNKSVFPIILFMEALPSLFPNVTWACMVWTPSKSPVWEAHTHTITGVALQGWGTVHSTLGLWLPGVTTTRMKARHENAGSWWHFNIYTDQDRRYWAVHQEMAGSRCSCSLYQHCIPIPRLSRTGF